MQLVAKRLRVAEKTDMDDVTRLGYKKVTIPQKHVLLGMTVTQKVPRTRELYLARRPSDAAEARTKLL